MNTLFLQTTTIFMFHVYFYRLLLLCVGINIWIKLKIQLVATIKCFNRSWLSYKKYIKVL